MAFGDLSDMQIYYLTNLSSCYVSQYLISLRELQRNFYYASYKTLRYLTVESIVFRKTSNKARQYWSHVKITDFFAW